MLVSVIGFPIKRWRYHALAFVLSLSFVSTVPPATAADADANADVGHDPIAAIVAKVSPAVVRVVTVRPLPPVETPPMTTVAANVVGERTSTALGSGSIHRSVRSFIATNKHVVIGAISVFVVTTEGVRYPATIVGMAGKADMALLLRSTRATIFAIRPGFGDSDKMHPGDRAQIAIESPFGFDTSVSNRCVVGAAQSRHHGEPVRRLYPDRRGHQSRQLRRPAVQYVW